MSVMKVVAGVDSPSVLRRPWRGGEKCHAHHPERTAMDAIASACILGTLGAVDGNHEREHVWRG